MRVRFSHLNNIAKVLTLLTFLFFLHPLSYAFASLQDEVFNRLDSVRTVKKEQIRALFDNLRNKAEGVRSDKVMRDFFFFMDDLSREGFFRRGAKMSGELTVLVDEYGRTIDQYYLRNYLDFYDIMFIDRDGEIFYTILKEGDFRSNIFSEPLAKTELSRLLRENSNTFFVDYQYYSPADEPAAFFIEPVFRDGRLEGWIVLQYAINKLNALLVDYRELGETGEVYLVNRQHYILNNSRYSAEETSLRMRIDNAEVRKALEGKSGHMVVKGYRGVRVFSSYESFDLWGTKWALVASIDEDEVLTDDFLQKEEKIAPVLFRHLAGQTQTLRRERIPSSPSSRKVDMDEVVKGNANDLLHTRGVSTCTAVTVTMPERFAYLAHISPFDKIYDENNLTHHLKALVNRIKYYDIHLYELRELRFVVVANHLASISNIIGKLSKYGIHLSQITFAYNPAAHYANVTCEGGKGETFVEWTYDGDTPASSVQKVSDVEDLATAYKKVSGYRF